MLHTREVAGAARVRGSEVFLDIEDAEAEARRGTLKIMDDGVLRSAANRAGKAARTVARKVTGRKSKPKAETATPAASAKTASSEAEDKPKAPEPAEK